MCFPGGGYEWEGNGWRSSRCCQGSVGPVSLPSRGKRARYSDFTKKAGSESCQGLQEKQP